MADTIERVRFTNKDALPEELREYDSFGKDENNRAAFFDAGGNVVHRIGNVTELAMKTMVSLNVAEEVGQIETPEQKIARLEARVQELERRNGKNSATKDEVSPDVQIAIDQAVAKVTKEFQNKISSLEENFKTQIAGLEEDKSRLEAENARLRDELEGSQETKPKTKPIEQKLKERFGERETPANKDAVKVDFEDLHEDNWTAVSDPYERNDGFFIKVTDGEDIKEVPLESVAVAQRSPEKSPAANRRHYIPRETLWRRARNMTPWAAESREWYIDDHGPYYLDPEGREIYVSEEEVNGRRTNAAVIAGSLVVGAVLWELVGEKIFGIGEGSSHSLKTVIHNQSVEISKLQDINHHLTDVDNHIHRELWHDHKHELRKITSLQKEVKDMRADLRGSGSGFKDHMQNSGAYWSFRYPWDWAASKVGTYRAESWLHQLAAKAAQHGHHVHWIYNGHEPNGSVREILQVDGTTNTQRVLSIIGKYR